MNTSTVSPNTTVLNAFIKSLTLVNAIPNPAEHKKQMGLLVGGAQVDAKVVGVFNIFRVQEMISRLKHFIQKKQLSNGNWYYRFTLPSSFTAFTPYVRIDDLYEEFQERIDKLGLLVEVRPVRNEAGEVSFKLHAPRIIPRKTTYISFILNSDETQLVEWFSGNLPEAGGESALVSNRFNLGNQWVRLGSYTPLKKADKAKPGKPQEKPERHLTTGLGEVFDAAVAEIEPSAADAVPQVTEAELVAP